MVSRGRSRGAAGGRQMLERIRSEPLGAFWLGVGLVVAVTALSVAADLAGPASAGCARLFGWPAIALPVGVLSMAVRRRVGSAGRADPWLVLLAGLLAASSAARMHAVLGVLVGVR